MIVLVLALPFVVALALAARLSASKRSWLLAIVVIALLEALLLELWGDRRPMSFAQLVLVLLLPWSAVLVTIGASPYPRRALLVAMVTPVVYFCTLAMAVVAGVRTGLLSV